MREKRRRRKIRVNKILRPISVLLLILLLQIILNFDTACYLFNRDSYTEAVAVVAEEKTDPFLLLIPMVELQYEYNGTGYSADKFFVLPPAFGLSGKQGDTVEIYINTLAPEYVIFHTPFYRNLINWILVIISLCCIYRIVRLIQEKAVIWKRKREEKKEEKIREERRG